MRLCFFLYLFCLFTFQNLVSQNNIPIDWHQKQNDTIFGTNTTEALLLLKSLKIKPKGNVVVGVIDTGVDTTHEDLIPAFWKNKKEKEDGKDNDKNGYIDDLIGWNFLGTPDNSFNMIKAGTEEFREFKRLHPKYKDYSPDSISNAQIEDEYQYYLTMRKEAKINTYISYVNYLRAKNDALDFLKTKAHCSLQGPDTIFVKDVLALDFKDSLALKAQETISFELLTAKKGATWEDLMLENKEKFEQAEKRLNSIETEKDKRLLMQDDLSDANDRFYGNPNVMLEDYEHGSAVVGLIALQGKNEKGLKGVYPPAKIMIIRAIPDGDEYDKDISSAIIYAVDNGAKIINMSFGKKTSPNSKMVEEAIAYAAKKDVLLIQAAGNDGQNIDEVKFFPLGVDKNGKRRENLIRVGATNYKGVPSRFSNYGKENVDLFAPGEALTIVFEKDKYKQERGTSLAAPIVSGIAAMIRHHFPKLSAAEVKDVLMKTVTPIQEEIILPGTKEEVAFSSICVSGGIVNALEAVKYAKKKSKEKK